MAYSEEFLEKRKKDLFWSVCTVSEAVRCEKRYTGMFLKSLWYELRVFYPLQKVQKWVFYRVHQLKVDLESH